MEKFRPRIQEEEERMTPTDAEPNSFHFRPKHKHHVAHKEAPSGADFLTLHPTWRNQEGVNSSL
ncbi:hypothetical protein YC2023_103936 [Brassica napus]